MTVFDTNPSLRWLMCMTHPDDEISICAWMRRMRLSGAEVFISWTHATAIRADEALKAAEKLNIPIQNLYFHDAPDGGVHRHLGDLVHRFSAMMEAVQPDRVCCGAFEQGHIDHDSTNLLVHATFGGPVFEIPFYHHYTSRIQKFNRFSVGGGEELIHLNQEEIEFKRAFAKGYPSQNIYQLLSWYEGIETVKGKRGELARTERMRLQTHFDFLKPHVPDAKRARVERTRYWQEFRIEAEQFLIRHPVKSSGVGAYLTP